MSWREMLGVANDANTAITHNPQNTQKPRGKRGYAEIAYSALEPSESADSRRLEALSHACAGLDLTPGELREALTPEELDGYLRGEVSECAIADFASALVTSRQLERGTRPEHFQHT